MRTHPFLVAGIVVFIARPALAQETALDGWLNDRLDEAVAGFIEQRGSGRQTEAPATSSGSTTILDNAGFADLVGVALNLFPTLSQTAGGGDPKSVAVTISPYTVLSALTGADPSSPIYYHRSSMWRRLAITIGTEEADTTSGTEAAALIGLKARLWSRQSLDPSTPGLAEVREALDTSAVAFGNLRAEVIDSLIAWVQPTAGRTNFINQNLSDQAAFDRILNGLSEARRARLLDIIGRHLAPFVRLRTTADALVEELRSQPTLSLDVQSRLRSGGDDEVNIGLVLDIGLSNLTTFTFNGSATFVNASGEDLWGGSVAAGLQLDFGPDHAAGRDPLALSLAAKGQFMNSQDATFSAQAKLTVPLIEGVHIPLSITWANRADLVNEATMLGRLGVTVDTSRLLAAIGGD